MDHLFLTRSVLAISILVIIVCLILKFPLQFLKLEFHIPLKSPPG